jgi:hypothetical protein
LFCFGYLLASRIVGRTLMLGLGALLERYHALFLMPGYLLSFLTATGTKIYMFRIGYLIWATRFSLRTLVTDEPRARNDYDFVHVGIPALIYVGFMYSLNPLKSMAFVIRLTRVCVQVVIEKMAAIHPLYAGGLIIFVFRLISLCVNVFRTIRNPIAQGAMRIARRGCDNSLKEILKYTDSQYASFRRMLFKDELFWLDSTTLEDMANSSTKN